jgi:hypothetical protein
VGITGAVSIKYYAVKVLTIAWGIVLKMDVLVKIGMATGGQTFLPAKNSGELGLARQTRMSALLLFSIS